MNEGEDETRDGGFGAGAGVPPAATDEEDPGEDPGDESLDEQPRG